MPAVQFRELRIGVLRDLWTEEDQAAYDEAVMKCLQEEDEAMESGLFGDVELGLARAEALLREETGANAVPMCIRPVDGAYGLVSGRLSLRLLCLL